MKEFKLPKLMLTPPNKRILNKYCHLYKDHGHDNEECLQLKKEIECHLKWRLLTKYA